MKFVLSDPASSGLLYLYKYNKDFHRDFFRQRSESILTIAWNRGKTQTVKIDGVNYRFPTNTILPLMVNQTFYFEDPTTIIAWQFNREFYCIVDHDKEVSCVGFLFYHSHELMFLQISKKETKSLEALSAIFEEEFETRDNIQAEMLRMLLKRLIIKCTRMAKEQYLSKQLNEKDYNIVRHYNLLVENNYKKLHSVTDYAKLLNRSAKTLSNLFALYNHKTPLQVINERLIIEARRMLLFTDKNSKEISYELGFDDPAHFSKFFKKHTGTSPSSFKGNNTKAA